MTPTERYETARNVGLMTDKEEEVLKLARNLVKAGRDNFNMTLCLLQHACTKLTDDAPEPAPVELPEGWTDDGVMVHGPNGRAVDYTCQCEPGSLCCICKEWDAEYPASVLAFAVRAVGYVVGESPQPQLKRTQEKGAER